MKKRFLTLSLIFLLPLTTLAFDNQSNHTAKFLVDKGIITEANDYRLNDTITRREMLKVMMNLSGKEVPDTCTGKYQDLNASDWGCKYAEAALANGYIAANPNFRPDDLVSNIEALKMIMQAQEIEQHQAEDWRVGYREKARDIGIIPLSVFNFSNSASRGYVFATSAKTYTHLYGSDIVATLSQGWSGHDGRAAANNELLEARGTQAGVLYPGSDIDRIFLWGFQPNPMKLLPAGSQISAKILSDRDIEEIHCNPFDMEFGHLCESPFYRDYEILILGTNFNNIRNHQSSQSCGMVSDFSNASWYESLVNSRFILGVDDIEILCYFDELGVVFLFQNNDIFGLDIRIVFIDDDIQVGPNWEFMYSNSLTLGEGNFDRVLHFRGTILTFTVKNKNGETRLIQLDMVK